MTEPTLILLPGMDGTGRLFTPLLTALGERPAVVLDHPTDRALPYDALYDLLLPRLPDGPLVAVGESFSGPLAIRLAAEHRAVVGLALVATFARAPTSRALIRLGALIAVGPPPRPAIRAMLAGTDAPAELVSAVRDAIAAVGPGVISARLRAVADVDVTADLARTTCPALYLHARRDRLVGESALNDVRRARPDLVIRSFDAPHLLAQRQPDAVADALAELTAISCPASP